MAAETVEAGPTNEELTDAYRRFRSRLTAMGRELDEATAAQKTPTCPDWSAKDVLAHMTGIARDILDGNIAEAATEAWADAQVARRADDSLADVLDEWDRIGPELESVLAGVASGIAFQFYLDAWTHEWDLRQAIHAPAIEPDMSLVAHTLEPLLDNLDGRMTERSLGLDLTLTGVPGGDLTRSVGVPPAEPLARTLPLFDYLRLAMGRRSVRQIETLLTVDDLPAGPWADAFVVWTANEHDIDDPVIR